MSSQERKIEHTPTLNAARDDERRAFEHLSFSVGSNCKKLTIKRFSRYFVQAGTLSNMGQSISSIRNEAEIADEQEKQKMQERLQILEKMVDSHLDKELQHVVNGERGDQEIHAGTVVSHFKEVNVKMSNKESPDLDKAIDDFFDGAFLKRASKLLHLSVRSVLGNESMGEYEASSMFIVWNDNALVRCDAYCYRWNFASKGVIENVEGAVGILLLQRVIDITKTNPQVLTWAISRQAAALGEESKASTMIDEATSVIKKVVAFQRDLKKLNASQVSGQ